MKFEVEIPDQFLIGFENICAKKATTYYTDDADGKRYRRFEKRFFPEPQYIVLAMIRSELLRLGIGLGKTDQISCRKTVTGRKNGS